MQVFIGFVIALLVGCTGIGGGSFTAPALVLLAGLSGAEAVGTALVFSVVVRLVAAPFYVAGKQVHFRYLWLMLLGGFPGLLAGTYVLTIFNARRWNHVVLIMIGATLISSSVLTFLHRRRKQVRPQSRASWLPWLSLPIGLETGFSSAGAGALGTLILLNCSDMPASRVVGTDLLFGIVLAAAGSLLHASLGSISGPALRELLLGGVPGVLVGCILAPRVPSIRLKPLILGLTLLLGVQLLWSGLHLIH
jgi:uncharacterized membrane protein YfcA